MAEIVIANSANATARPAEAAKAQTAVGAAPDGAFQSLVNAAIAAKLGGGAESAAGDAALAGGGQAAGGDMGLILQFLLGGAMAHPAEAEASEDEAAPAAEADAAGDAALAGSLPTEALIAALSGNGGISAGIAAEASLNASAAETAASNREAAAPLGAGVPEGLTALHGVAREAAAAGSSAGTDRPGAALAAAAPVAAEIQETAGSAAPSATAAAADVAAAPAVQAGAEGGGAQAGGENAGATALAGSQEPQAAAAEKAAAVPTAPYSQIGRQILASLADKGPTSFSMTLEPAELGRIDLNMRMSGDKLVISIAAESARTHALLLSQTDRLAAALGLHGVQVESVHVTGAAQAEGQGSGQQAERDLAYMMGFAGKDAGGGRREGGGSDAGHKAAADDSADASWTPGAARYMGRLNLTA
ncbi:MAG: flagellar hook-length control protein FliK [Clostridiales Family XIII bacterium]|nr:flagellar hook-length control protein FliK [Clostridiales Family XIII bacterium]